jgi:hypothetical protein
VGRANGAAKSAPSKLSPSPAQQSLRHAAKLQKGDKSVRQKSFRLCARAECLSRYVRPFGGQGPGSAVQSPEPYEVFE